MKIKTKVEKWFPNIVGKDFKIINTEGDYNCVAYYHVIDLIYLVYI